MQHLALKRAGQAKEHAYRSYTENVNHLTQVLQTRRNQVKYAASSHLIQCILVSATGELQPILLISGAEVLWRLLLYLKDYIQMPADLPCCLISA